MKLRLIYISRLFRKLKFLHEDIYLESLHKTRPTLFVRNMALMGVDDKSSSAADGATFEDLLKLYYVKLKSRIVVYGSYSTVT